MDKSFFQPEERDGYMVSSEMKEVWAVELDLLNEFSHVCEMLGLKWFVHAGTMLGAVRHHGFIPWDDDIDVVLPRKDYDYLCEKGPSYFTHPYFFQNEDTDRFFCRNFSRLRNSNTTAIQNSERDFCFPYNQGIFIDIFPLDNVPDDDNELVSSCNQIEYLTSIGWVYRNFIHFYRPLQGGGSVKRVKNYIRHYWFKYIDKERFDYNRILKTRNDLIVANNKIETRRVGEIVVPPIGRHIWDKEWLADVVFFPFEMLQVPVPSGYEQCLSVSYGEDWRTPKQQGNYHGQVHFDVSKPYTAFL